MKQCVTFIQFEGLFSMGYSFKQMQTAEALLHNNTIIKTYIAHSGRL